MFSTHVWMCICLDVDFYYYSKFGQIHTHKKPAWLLWSFFRFPHRFPLWGECGQKIVSKLSSRWAEVVCCPITRNYVSPPKYYLGWTDILHSNVLELYFSYISPPKITKKYSLSWGCQTNNNKRRMNDGNNNDNDQVALLSQEGRELPSQRLCFQLYWCESRWNTSMLWRAFSL